MLKSHQVQVSRSLGHKQLVEYGITWEPDTLVRTLDPDQAFAVVVLSDGVTDSLRRAVSLLWELTMLETCCERNTS